MTDSTATDATTGVKAPVDAYGYWRARLRGDKHAAEAARIPTGDGIDSSPQPGLYKTRKFRDGPYVPAMVWLESPGGNRVHQWRSGLTVRVAIEKEIIPPSSWDRFLFFTAVSKDQMDHYAKTGEWQGDVDSHRMPQAGAPDASGLRTVTMGDNSGELTPLDEIRDAMESAAAFLASHSRIANDVEASTAQNWRQRLTQLADRLKAIHKTEKAPHLEKCREIDRKYLDIVKDAEVLATSLRRAAEAYARAEEARVLAEAEARNRAALAAANAIEAERQARATAAGDLLPDDREYAPAQVEFVVPEKKLYGGQRGKRAGLKNHDVAKIVDIGTAAAALADNDELIKLIQKLTMARYKLGIATPGTEIVTERVLS